MSDLEWFFRCPRSAPESGQAFSQLYLLRRDIDTCFGTDPNTGISWSPREQTTGQRIYCHAIWPGTMAVLAGIDLLGKFLAGTDKTRGPGSVGVGTRFKQFAQRYLDLSPPDDHVIYQLRNALLHTFGLYAEDVDRDGNVTVTYAFVLGGKVPGLVQRLPDGRFQVDVQALRERFEKGVSRYAADLGDPSCQDQSSLKAKFDALFPKHAHAVGIGRGE